MTATNTDVPRGLHVEAWGESTPVVLVHGSLALGAEEWTAQRPLGEAGFRLLVPDRRGYGQSPEAAGEDFLRDAEDIVELMGDGAHLVGHSYGGLGVLFAAARRPPLGRRYGARRRRRLGRGVHAVGGGCHAADAGGGRLMPVLDSSIL